MFLEQISLQPTEKASTCAFTGHRELPQDFSYFVLKKQIAALIEEGVCTFYIGMARGFDLTAAKAVIALKKKYPHIKWIACVPFFGQEKHFCAADKKRYVSYLKKADETQILSEYYYKGCMHERDRFMADRADVLVAFLRHDTGGTAYTVRYFQKKYPFKRVIFL